MRRLVVRFQALIRELRRRQVIRVAVVYATTGFVILQLAEILVEPFGLGPRALRLITLVLILGFPLAVGLAWVFNVTEEGLVRAEAEAEREIGPEGKPLTSNGIIIGLLTVAVGLLLYPRVFSSGDEATGQASTTQTDTAQVAERSIAVLPFEPLSSGEESKTFARGAHDDLLTRLANISDLKVISRTAVQQYRDTDLTTGQIADSLGVRWVMEGGVQVLGDQIQVNAQLIDPRTETHAWASNYRRDLTAEDLFAIQGEITREIADALKAELTAAEQSRVTGAPTQNLQAYRLYVKGRSQLDTRTNEGVRRAAGYFQKALQHDSTYALAWSGLADTQGLSQYASDSLGVKVPSQEQAARRALRLDPDLAEAHASMGLFYAFQQNGPRALHHLKKAVDLKPSYAQARHWLGYEQLQMGRQEEGLRHVRRATELNPQHYAANSILVLAYLAVGQYEKALRQVRFVSRMEASWGVDQAADKATVLYHLGRFEEARQVLEKGLSEVGRSEASPLPGLLALVEAAMGDTTRAHEFLARPEEERDAFQSGFLHAALGHTDAAFEAFGQDEGWLSSPSAAIAFRSMFPRVLGPLREDPRYEELIGKINTSRGLNPDGSIPDSVGVTLPSRPEADA